MAKLRGTLFQRSNGTFTVQTEPIWDPGEGRKRRVSLGTYPTEREARQVQVEYNATHLDGLAALAEVDQRQVRIDQYLAEWLIEIREDQRADDMSRATRRDYETVVRHLIVPYLGSRRIGELTLSMIRRWLRDLKAGGVGDRTVQKAYRTLHRALADLNLPKNPVWLPKKHRPKVRQHRPTVYPTREQVEAFLDHVSECADPYGTDYAVMWRLAAVCGLRRAEVVGLAWSDVDIAGRTITINQTIGIDNRSLYVKGPKSERGKRTIRLDPITFRQLCRHRARTVKEKVAAGDEYRATPLGHDFVFRADRKGAPIRPDRITRAFKREWAHAGLSPGPTLHGLRHANGSLLLIRGVPPLRVAEHLGHDLQTLTKVYSHELDSDKRQRQIADAVGEIYG